jgi:hypothetical protein
MNFLVREFFSVRVLKDQTAADGTASRAETDQDSFCSAPGGEFLQHDVRPDWGTLRDFDIGIAKSIS